MTTRRLSQTRGGERHAESYDGAEQRDSERGKQSRIIIGRNPCATKLPSRQTGRGVPAVRLATVGRQMPARSSTSRLMFFHRRSPGLEAGTLHRGIACLQLLAPERVAPRAMAEASKPRVARACRDRIGRKNAGTSFRSCAKSGGIGGYQNWIDLNENCCGW